VLRDRTARLGDHGLELRLLGFRQSAELRHDQLVDQRQHAVVLSHRSLGVNLRHARGLQRLAHL
jgi:hypothetical protein